MKKLVFFVLLISAISVFAFAQTYAVENVTGRVERESGGQRLAVKAGDRLDSETVLFTGVGASVALKAGEKIVTIPAARNGKVTDLVKAASGVRISGNIARTDTGAANRATAQIGTASARASEAAGDFNVAAE